ncbi:MAG: flippase-like domain-containing protein [Chloroflexi bacterium]|nr:flippase-like domain-containing protein [Chloroflexota bacterium]
MTGSTLDVAETVSAAHPSARPARRVKPSTLLRIVVTVVVSALLVRGMDFSEVGRVLRNANWSFVVLAFGSAIVAMVVNVWRWQLMLKGQRSHVRLLSLVRLYMIGMFFNNVLPGRFGGDVVRAYGASLTGIGKTESAAAVLVDRLVGAISVLALGAVATLFEGSKLPATVRNTTIAGCALGVLVLGLMVYRNDNLAAFRLRVFELLEISVFGLRPRALVERVMNALRSYSRRPGLIGRGFLVSVVANGLSIVNLYLYARAVRADVNLGDVAMFAPFILAIGILPISLNGLGTQEAIVVWLFSLVGVPGELGLAVAILRRVVQFLLSLVGGPLYATRRFS